MIDYTNLKTLLRIKNIKLSSLSNTLNISSKTLSKINKNEKIANHVLVKIANFLEINVSEISEYVPDNPLLARLQSEKNSKISTGIYNKLQVDLTYNSNKIEGSSLSQEQTYFIFNTKTIGVNSSNILVDDIIETSNHFRAVDYVIEMAEVEISEVIIKELHKIIKQSTSAENIPYFKIGDYKAIDNEVGGRDTASVADTPIKIKELISKYLKISNVTFNDIIDFHYNFEIIHPFQDGNGRVGRLIMLKECLKHNITPFIIEDAEKEFYYRGLREYKAEPGFLKETCLHFQDKFKESMKYFNIDYND